MSDPTARDLLERCWKVLTPIHVEDSCDECPTAEGVPCRLMGALDAFLAESETTKECGKRCKAFNAKPGTRFRCTRPAGHTPGYHAGGATGRRG